QCRWHLQSTRCGKKGTADNGVWKHHRKFLTALQTFHRLTFPQPKSGAGQNLDDLLLFAVTAGNSRNGIRLVRLW
ncbi:MAG TPA: hypothetical protein VGL91_11795, partial [Acidobacteriota bacterium]